MTGAATAFLAAINLVHAFLFGGPIDGTAWDVKVRRDGLFHWGSARETLVFHGGRLVVAGAVNRGYQPAVYEARGTDEGAAFAAVLDSPDGQAVEWSGRVDGDRIAGVMVVRAPDGRVSRYAFRGSRKAG